MNYIGSKDRLLSPLIRRAMVDMEIPFEGRFADAFAGTHAVGEWAQQHGFRVFANDLQWYSFIIGNARLTPGSHKPPFSRLEGICFPENTPVGDRLRAVIDWLNGQIRDIGEPIRSAWFVDRYGEDGADGRLYFSRENAWRIQWLRDTIDAWPLSSVERSLLVYAVILAADKVANVASVYYTYLKALKKSATKPLKLEVPLLSMGHPAYVTRRDVVQFARTIRKVNVLYLDPPYNERQYAPNYHILETIAIWDDPQVMGKGGVRAYGPQKSRWCSKKTALGELEAVLEASDAQHVLMSYSNEGILTADEILDAMGKHGEVRLYTHEYPRFNSGSKKGAGRQVVTEYLFALRRS